MATIWRSPPESEPARWARRLAELGEEAGDEVEALGEVLGPLEHAHLHVLLDGQRGEHVVVLRNEADALG